MGVISNSLGSALSATTSIVDRLVEKKLVKRGSDPNDRRVVTCELTASGQEASERFWRGIAVQSLHPPREPDRGQCSHLPWAESSV